ARQSHSFKPPDLTHRWPDRPACQGYCVAGGGHVRVLTGGWTVTVGDLLTCIRWRAVLVGCLRAPLGEFVLTGQDGLIFRVIEVCGSGAGELAGVGDRAGAVDGRSCGERVSDRRA